MDYHLEWEVGIDDQRRLQDSGHTFEYGKTKLENIDLKLLMRDRVTQSDEPQ